MEALTVPGSLDSLAAIGQYVMAAAAEAGVEKAAAYRLRLSIDEIATNSIVHGYDEAGLLGDIVIRADYNEQSLTVSIEDSAAAFDPTKVPEPDGLERPLEDRNIGGLGIFLAIGGVDEFRYERVNNRNRNIFVVKRNAVSPNKESKEP